MLPQRDSLTPPDDHTHAKLEREVESMSDAIVAVDGFLYHANYNSKRMHQFFLSIAARAHKCANLVKTAETSL